jgi:proline dehydrogenase
VIYEIGLGVQRRVLAAGLPLRIVIPYGPTWFGYLMRRLAERPANLLFFLKNALGE